MALPLLGAAVRSIGGFLGRKAIQGVGAVGGVIAKKAAGLGIDAAAGTGKLAAKGAGKVASAPFKLFGSKDGEDGKMLDQSKLKTEQEIQEKKSIEIQKKQQQKQEKINKIDNFRASGRIREQKSEDSKKNQSVAPALKVLQSILSTLEVIKENVATLTKGEERDKRQDKKAAFKKLEKEREDARDQDIGPKEPGFIKKSISKIAQKGAGGIISSIFKGIALFFAGKYIIEKFFPGLKEPIFGFFKDIGNFFINLRDSIKALIAGDFGKAFDELKEAGSDAGSVFRKLAKFLSNLLDNFLVLLGFDEANLYEKSIKLISEIRPKIEKFFTDMKEYFNSFSNEEDPISTKIMNALVGILGKVFDKIASFLNPSNLLALADYAMDRGEGREQAQERIKDIEQDKGFQRKAKQSALEQLKSQGIEGTEKFKNIEEFQRSLKIFVKGKDKGRRTDLTEQELAIEKAIEGAYQDQLNFKKAELNEIGEIKEMKRRLELQRKIAPDSDMTRSLEEQIQEKTKKYPELQMDLSSVQQRRLNKQNMGKRLQGIDEKTTKNLEFDGKGIATSSYAAFAMNEGNKSYNISNDQVDQSLTTIHNARTVQIDGSPTNILTADPTSSSYFRPVK